MQAAQTVTPASRHTPRQSPTLCLDLAEVERNVRAIRAALPGVDVHYAVKANPHQEVMRRLHACGVGFEIASQAELTSLLTLGIPPDRMLCLHPIKSPDFVSALHDAQVGYLAADCRQEVEKIATLAPGAGIAVRLAVSNEGSRLHLNGKFGCEEADALELLMASRECGVPRLGITTHVGSQCESLKTWSTGIAACERVFVAARDAGLPLELVSLGGGLPVPYETYPPSWTDIGRLVAPAAFSKESKPPKITIEPGRAIVATAGTLVATVIGAATRRGFDWLYLDAGIYQGMFEALPAAIGIRFPIEVPCNNRPLRRYRIAGPTCDGLDVLPDEYSLPEIYVGEQIRFRCAGAYSSTLANRFNGFDPPEVTIVGEPEDEVCDA